MIEVTYKQRQDGFAELTADGHAGQARKGEDLVCAAATVLALTLADFVENRGGAHEIEIRDGYVRIVAGMENGHAFETILHGFLLLQDMEPEYVRLEQIKE